MDCGLRARFWACVLACGVILGNAGEVAAQPVPVEIVIASVAPAIAQPNAVITIRYHSIGQGVPVRPSVSVYIEGEKSEVFAATDGLIQARVPSFKVGGKKSILVTGDLLTREPWTSFEVAVQSSPDQTVPTSIFSRPEWFVLATALSVASLFGLLLWYRRRAAASTMTSNLQDQLDKVRDELKQQMELAAVASKAAAQSEPAAGGVAPDGTESAAPDSSDIVVVPAVPPELVSACSSGNCVLFASSGFSAQTGLLTWTEFLAQFLSDLEREESPSNWSPLREELSRGSAGIVVDLLHARGKTAQLRAALGATYDRTVSIPRALTNLFSGVPFSGALTTNLDTVLEAAAASRQPRVIRLKEVADFGALLREKQFFVLKLHGDATEPTSMVIGQEEFLQAFDETPNLRTFVGSIFASHTVLFMGASLAGIEWFLSASRIKAGPSSLHFALVPDEPNFEVAAERFLSRFRIKLLRYTPTDGFSAVPAFAQELARQVELSRPAAAAGTDGSIKLQPSRVEKVVLKNIGPFTDMEFTFPKPWTVLLGNNGCGKSTVLRAIALALSGDDDEAKRAGASLLRSGAEFGSIEVTVGSIPFVTKLIRERGRVLVRAEQIPPLKAGTLVAMGFPAVRGVGGTAAGKNAFHFPVVDDVMPLLRGGADARATDVRDWIVRTAVKSRDGNVPEAQRKRYIHMLDAFFRMLNDMTPGFDLRFESANSETSEVMLRTSDGLLPMDHISQGMHSTIGWLGMLMQRLFDIYRSDEEPEKQHALLLIDEIDSHLHPEWQRIIVPKIKHHFPGLQVIASTHSPLLVGNVEVGELIKFTRGETGVIVEALDESFKGYRADQILTGAAFGLESSRNPEWEAKRRRYAELLGQSSLEKAEQKELQELEEELSDAPRSQETAAGRQGAQLVNDAVRQRLKDMPLSDEDKKKVFAEAKLYLTKVGGA